MIAAQSAFRKVSLAVDLAQRASSCCAELPTAMPGCFGFRTATVLSACVVLRAGLAGDAKPEASSSFLSREHCLVQHPPPTCHM